MYHSHESYGNSELMINKSWFSWDAQAGTLYGRGLYFSPLAAFSPMNPMCPDSWYEVVGANRDQTLFLIGDEVTT